MKYKKNWEETKEKWKNYWKHQNTGRPLMCVVARKPEIEHLVGEDSGDGCMQGRYYAMPEDLKWKDMLKNHLTTCAEDPLKSRSDCHAWGALALYELPSVILGVRPAAPGYEKIEINPETGFFSQAEGQVITPKGMVTVSWKKQGEKVIMDVKVPNGISYYCNCPYN